MLDIFPLNNIKTKLLKFKTSKQRFALLTFLMFSLTFFFSCKKQDKELQETKNYIPIKKQTLRKT
jgi:hypothetical protein